MCASTDDNASLLLFGEFHFICLYIIVLASLIDVVSRQQTHKQTTVCLRSSALSIKILLLCRRGFVSRQEGNYSA